MQQTHGSTVTLRHHPPLESHPNIQSHPKQDRALRHNSSNKEMGCISTQGEQKCDTAVKRIDGASSPTSFPFRAPSLSQSSAGRHAGREDWVRAGTRGPG